MQPVDKHKIDKKSLILIAVVAVMAIAFVLGIDGPEKIFNSLKKANPFWLFVATACYAFSWYLEGVILYILVKKTLIANFSHSEAVELAVIGKLFDNLTPSATGGQPFQAWKLKKRGAPVSTSVSILFFKFAVGHIVTVIYFSLTLLLNRAKISAWPNSQVSIIIISYLLNLGFAILLIVAGTRPKLLKNLANSVVNILGKIKIINERSESRKNISREIDSFHNGFKKIAKNYKQFVLVVGLSIVQVTCIFSVGYFVFLALGSGITDWFSSVSASAYVWMLSTFIPLPGASIGAEGGFLLFFSEVYHNQDSVALAMIVWRFVTYYLPIIFSFIYLFDFNKLKKIPLVNRFITKNQEK